MSPEVLRRLGEPFFTTKAPGRGTGLGLATAYGIVTDLRGTLRCRSELGSGTSFELRLPLHRYHDTPSATLTTPLRVPERLHALVIDDEELVQNTLRRALERAGAKVSCASTGEEGLATFRAHPGIGLVLLDLAMPGLGGAEVLRRLKAIDPSVAAYVMTGFLPDGLDLKLANGIVTKPIDMKHLHAIINEVATNSS
jgi:CheY-like chemotaxis protein